MAQLKKNPFTIKESQSSTLGIVYNVFNKAGDKLKTFISSENAERYATQLFLELQADKSLRSGKPNGITRDLKAEFGENFINE
jgi:hypothetical protein